MAHHRGLVITMLVVVVVFIVGTGAMAWATNDTDESVQEELASARFGLTGEGPESSASYQTIDLILVPVGERPVRVNITPSYDTHPGAKCVKRDATNPAPVEVSRETVVTVGVTVLGTFATGCHINRSQMFWAVSNRAGAGGQARDSGVLGRQGELPEREPQGLAYSRRLVGTDSMAHHRGLIIALVVAVALGGVFVGVMALTTNDRDTSVQDELGTNAREFNLSFDEDADNLSQPGRRLTSNSETFRFVMRFLFDRISYGMRWDRARSHCVEDATSYDHIKVPSYENPKDFPAFARFSRDGQCASQVAVAVFNVGASCRYEADLFLEQRARGGPVEARWQPIHGNADGLDILGGDPPVYGVAFC